MSKPLLLVGLGGFGKWVVTSFKSRILDVYGNKPDHIDWVAFDLAGEEIPVAEFTRFELGRVKRERLDFSNTSQEFFLFGADYAHYVRRARQDEPDDVRFAGRLTKSDANLLVLGDERKIPAAERRHASMLQFQLRVEDVSAMLRRKLQPDSYVFVVNSIAGGTGTGTFIDFLLLLRQHMRETKGTLLSVLLLPEGFARVKQNEDMKPLYGNCYAAFREFMRLQYPKGNVRLCFSVGDLALREVSKTPGDPLSDVVYLVDGSNFGRGVEYYRGVVPAITTFVEQSFLAAEQEEKTGARHQTSFDNAVAHAKQNLLNAPDPYDAFALSSFGTCRMVFDRDAVKTGFAHEIARRAFSQFLADSWLTDPEFAVKQFAISPQESTRFDKELVHDCVTKAPDPALAGSRSLPVRLEEGVKFPRFNIAGIKPQGSLAETRALADKREGFWMGTPGEKYAGPTRVTVHAACDYYRRHYVEGFRRSVSRRVLDMLNKDRGKPEYGRGSLRACERFAGALLGWYILFLRGDPEKNIKARFAEACELADATEGTAGNAARRAEEYFEANKNRRKWFSDLRPDYLALRERAAELKVRDEIRKLVGSVAADNLAYLEMLYQDLAGWLETFRQSRVALDEATSNLLEVRAKRREVVTDEYLTLPGDEIETALLAMIVDGPDRKRIENGKDLRSPLEHRLREVLDDVPSPGWDKIVGGFEWRFNTVDDESNYQSSTHRPGGLICSVPAQMPGFPVGAQWTRGEFVRAWNYELVRFYLEEHRLNSLDRLSAAQVLMLRGDDPDEVLQGLMERSGLMAALDRSVLEDPARLEGLPFAPEYHYFIFADDGCQDRQVQLAAWLKKFRARVAGLPDRSYTFVSDHQRPHMLAFSTARYSLPAAAFTHLVSTEPVYRERLKNNVPPPLHVLPGEKLACGYEACIARRLRHKTPGKLHPLVVSLLERESALRDFGYGLALGLVTTDQVRNDKRRKVGHVTVGGVEFLAEGPEPMLLSEVLHQLVYPDPGKKDAHTNALADLAKAIEGKTEAALTRAEREGKKLVQARLKDDLPTQERDLFRVWLEMFDE
jgi:hypothetical protein